VAASRRSVAAGRGPARTIGSVRYIWVAIIAATAVPLLYVGWLANPLAVAILGVDRWQERVARLHPYRWWILFLMLVCAFSVAVYIVSYA
jgi:hypothetical protein